ncbi:MAG: hypothetical protein ACC707_11600 [Thiohalomonadales bacterium]
MYSRLDKLPVYETRATRLSALHFNHVQLALKRLGDSFRFPIPKLKHLDLILEKQAWIIVDHVLNDIPVAAWSDFQIEHREDIHSPILCKLRIYHAHADLILSRSIEAMEMILGEELADLEDNNVHKILAFKRKKT